MWNVHGNRLLLDTTRTDCVAFILDERLSAPNESVLALRIGVLDNRRSLSAS
jgi:hypothetical protein